MNLSNLSIARPYPTRWILERKNIFCTRKSRLLANWRFLNSLANENGPEDSPSFKILRGLSPSAIVKKYDIFKKYDICTTIYVHISFFWSLTYSPVILHTQWYKAHKIVSTFWALYRVQLTTINVSLLISPSRNKM